MVHQPIHPYQSAQGWVSYHSAIALALSNMGVVPYIRDASVNADMLKALVDTAPNVIGVKYAVPNSLQFANLVGRVGPTRLAWICGLAEMWAPFFWLAGARGFTSGLANVNPKLSLQMFESLNSGDFDKAMQEWAQLKPFEDLRAIDNNANNVPVVKEALAQLEQCGRTVRPPITELSEPQRKHVTEILVGWQMLPNAH